MKGIDAAKWQGRIDWRQVKNAGVEFAILKILDKTGSTEEAFERNFEGAASQGLPTGVYNYSYARSADQARRDAQRVIEALRGRKLQYGVWMDVEDSVLKGLGKELISMILSYRSVIEEAGGKFGVYTGLSFYNSYIKPYGLPADCPFWIARYPSGSRMELTDNPAAGKKPDILHPLWGWQYSSKGRVPGIPGDVDLNIMYGVSGKGETSSAGGNPYAEPEVILYRFRKNMKEENVKWLQYELNEMGFALAVDGRFGPATDKALRNAQKKLGIKVDGKCGPETKKRLSETISMENKS